MNCSSLARLLVTFAIVCCGITSADAVDFAAVDLVNCGTNTLNVGAATLGVGSCSTNQQARWWVAIGDTATNYVGTAAVGTWSPVSGHSYSVVCDAGTSSVSVVDTGDSDTAYWWGGFSLIFITGLLALAARSVRSLIGGGINE